VATQTNSVPGTGYSSLYLDSLVWGCGWTGDPVSYYFGSGFVPAIDSSVGAFNGASWSDAEKSAFSTALAQYSAVCNLTFAQAGTQDAANVVWWKAPQSAMGAGTLGMHEVPDESYSQIYGYFNYQDSSWGNLTPGSYGFVTVIHELGHGMGLAHPHDGGDHSDATRFPGVTGPWTTGTYGLNQGIWTTMSYNDGWNVAPSPSSSYGYQRTLMALDVAALQALYGANMTTRTGDDTYSLPGTNVIGTGWTCLWDAGGTDTISNAGSSLACTINLNEAALTGPAAGGYVSRAVGIVGGYTVAHGAVIENATGGLGNDTLIGNAAGNVLDGGAGADSLSGGAGDDVYVVDNSRDVVKELLAQGTDWVWSSTATYVLASNVENLLLTGTANIAGTGSSTDNVLLGNSGNNLLNGGSGNDLLDGDLGVDKLTGGKGADVFRFEQGDAGVGSGLRDVITDFKGNDGDRIDLSLIDANAFVDGLQAFSYIGGASFSGTAGELRFSAKVLAADVTGDGLADFEIELAGVRSFSALFLAT